MGLNFPVTNGAPYERVVNGRFQGGYLGEIVVNFSHPFYWGEDPAAIPSHATDLPTVILHELGHIIGVFGLATSDGDSELPGTFGGVFSVFETMVYRGQTDAHPLFTNGVLNNPMDLWSDDLWFRGPSVLAVNNGNPVPVFASGGYYGMLSHLAPGTDSVMVPYVEAGEVRRTFSPIDLAVLRDIGWNIVPEPDAFALLLAAAAGVLHGRRRGRRCVAGCGGSAAGRFGAGQSR